MGFVRARGEGEGAEKIGERGCEGEELPPGLDGAGKEAVWGIGREDVSVSSMEWGDGDGAAVVDEVLG